MVSNNLFKAEKVLHILLKKEIQNQKRPIINHIKFLEYCYII